ncbi:MAG: hypothetical protein O7H39_00390 [Gammaproteobacteria bacterium]|nr:hypothetical protein [Gammaproteobacteria bacterium]
MAEQAPIAEQSPRPDQNVYQAPAADLDTGRSTTEYGGLNRGKYFLYSIGLQVVYYILLAIFAAVLESPVMIGIAVVAMFIGAIYLGFQRFVNIGTSGWWILMVFVPIANFYYGVKALAFPEGYDDHRQMDTTGKVIIGLFVGMIVLGIGSAILVPMLVANG